MKLHGLTVGGALATIVIVAALGVAAGMVLAASIRTPAPPCECVEVWG